MTVTAVNPAQYLVSKVLESAYGANVPSSPAELSGTVLSSAYSSSFISSPFQLSTAILDLMTADVSTLQLDSRSAGIITLVRQTLGSIVDTYA